VTRTRGIQSPTGFTGGTRIEDDDEGIVWSAGDVVDGGDFF
jgi:hypothetical protein